MSLMSTIQVGEQLLTNQVDIKNHVLDLFSSLYAYDNQCKDYDFTTRVTPSQVSDEDNIMLTNLPTLEEVKLIIFDNNVTGAPGPYGFIGFFFQHYWEKIQQDVFNSVL